MKSMGFNARFYSRQSVRIEVKRHGKLPLEYNFTGLLVMLAVAVPLNFTLPPKPTMAQATLAQFSALDKNLIYVNSRTGSDSDTGKKFAPLKTITQALKTATPGVTIELAAGTYSQETGETFPLIIGRGITLKGNTDNQGYKTIVKGSGDFTSPTGAGQNVAIAALKDAAAVMGITVTNEHGRGHGLWVESASPKIIGNTFTRNGNTGLSVNGNSAPVVENNYFYNNSGNGLLVYGTSQPEVIDNTFEQTGFGVSAVQNAAPILRGNKFDGNRIGIILEGDSQGILRDNEIINSEESGLTAIANSQVDLGTSAEPGNNIFRSNKKLDIQNATSQEIVAVGTQVKGQISGNINFERGEFVAINQAVVAKPAPTSLNPTQSTAAKSSLPSLPPLPKTAPDTTANPNLPAPPPVVEENGNNKELVFTPSSNTASSSPVTEPVPFPPAVSNVALGGNNSQLGSLSDVLGTATVKYKVLVEALNETEESEVRSLYPEAFETVFDGQSLLQIGAFSSWDKARQAEAALINLGLETFLLE